MKILKNENQFVSTRIALFGALLMLLFCGINQAGLYAQDSQNKKKTKGSMFSKYRNFPRDWWGDYSEKDLAWFKSDKAKNIANNIISWQTPEGGWPLMNTTNEPSSDDESALSPWGRHGTFIHATTNEIKFLSRIFQATGEEKYKQSVLIGLHYIFEAQTQTGGWPKAYPLVGDDYKKHNTFNDGAMENIMFLLKEMQENDTYAFLDSSQMAMVNERYNLGIDCILKSQIVTNGKLTAWCQQHDEKNYLPRSGRTFEPAAISGSESVGIIKLLMDIENPSPKVKKAIECAVKWVEESKIEGIKVITIPDSTYKAKGIDRVVVPEPGNILWARYYEIETNQPVFYGRDGIKKYKMAEIDQERRTGYAWYGAWGEGLQTDYEKWAAKHGLDISESAKMNSPEDGFFVTSDSVRIHYLTKGEGTPVILIHGLSGTAYGNWFPNGVADSLAKNHLVVAIDCRNHGLSDNPAGELSWGSELEVIELMDHLKIEKVHLHGYSMGGAIVGQMMAQVPERIITASMGGYGIQETDPEWIAKVPAESKGYDNQAKEAYLKLLQAYAKSRGMSEKETLDFINAPRPSRPRILPPPLEIDLTKIEFPVMTLLGEFDSAVKKSHRMLREIKNMKHVVLPGKSHNTAIMAGYMPKLYVDSLVGFIDDNEL